MFLLTRHLCDWFQDVITAFSYWQFYLLINKYILSLKQICFSVFEKNTSHNDSKLEIK